MYNVKLYTREYRKRSNLTNKQTNKQRIKQKIKQNNELLVKNNEKQDFFPINI